MKSNEDKTINFSIGELRIGNSLFGMEYFSEIEEDGNETMKISQEIISVNIFNKKNIEERFVSFSFEMHDKYPYPPNVVNVDDSGVTTKENPRGLNDMEPKEQFLVLVDSLTQLVYLSDRRKKDQFIHFLKKNNKSSSSVLISPLIEEKEFLNNIDTVKEISLTVEKGKLFNDTSTLSKHLTEDIHNFEADEINLSMKYKNGISARDGLGEKIKYLLKNKTPYKRLSIIGRKTNKFESVFNLDGVNSRIPVKTGLEEKTKRVNPEEVFLSLILKIKQNEEETK